MKKTFLFALLLLAGLATFSSCDELDDKGVDMRTETFDVYQDEWGWNAAADRFEVIFDYDEIDSYMYEHGSIVGAVYITEKDEQTGGTFEVVHPLPYTYSYRRQLPGGTTEEITETISFNAMPGTSRYPGTIAFYIQTSSQASSAQWLSNYTFKVTTFWRD